jgi:hypothetical protein
VPPNTALDCDASRRASVITLGVGMEMSDHPATESALPLHALKRSAIVCFGSFVVLLAAQFAGLINPHHPTFPFLMVILLAFYLATALLVLLSAKGLYYVARNRSLRNQSSTHAFFAIVLLSTVVVTMAFALGTVW